MIGAMIAIPFSPLRTKRPIVRQVWKPATRVAVGHWLAMRQTLCQENVHRSTMLTGRRDEKRARSFCALGEHSPSEFQNADAWLSVVTALESAW